jgi:hypothetical protein
MKSSIVSLFPGERAGINRALPPLLHWGTGLWRRRRPDLIARPFVKPAVPELRILRSIPKTDLFSYAIRANKDRWETLVFASLAFSALAALALTLRALIGE